MHVKHPQDFPMTSDPQSYVSAKDCVYVLESDGVRT